MKIDEAIIQYRNACANSDTPPFYQITSQLIEAGHDESFSNDSYFDALCLTHVMLCRTFVGASILTGAGANKFWGALKNPLEDCLLRLTSVGGKVRMIILNGNNLDYLKSLKEKFPGTFEMITAKTSANMNHFVVCDDRMVRIEDIHPPLDGIEVNDEMVKARVNFNDHMRAKQNMKFFEAAWQKLQGPKLEAAKK